MPSSLNTAALQSLLESDLLDLDKFLEFLDISKNDLSNDLSTDLLERLSGLIPDNLADSLSVNNLSVNNFVQTLSQTASATANGSDTKSTIQSLIGAGSDRFDLLNRFSLNSLNNALTQSNTASTSPTAVFAFANSIFSNRKSSDRIQSLLGKTAEAYQSFIPPDAAAFTTVARNGQRINNGRGSAQPLKWTNSSNGQTNVTFAFDDAFAVNGLSFDKAKSLVVKALSTWAQYAPLNFQEIQDPGDGNRVDILVQSDAIDGIGKTLAFAYFPTFGDITFDKAERWNDSKFLETAVHELGHSLGLGHESDVSAIMNPVLDNKFAGKDDPFLLQDDINGIRNLYGSGSGSVFTLGQGVAQPKVSSVELPIGNLVANGSFEETSVKANSFGTYKRIKGWNTLSGGGFKIDRRTQSVGSAADGSAWLELNLYGDNPDGKSEVKTYSNKKNTTIYQNVDTLTGQDYTLSLDFTSNGRDRDSTAIDVFWEGKKLDRITGGGLGQWTSYQYQVEGGKRNVSTLAFRSPGAAVDNMGGFIDNISLFAKANATAPDSHVCGPSCGSHCANSHSHRHQHDQGESESAYKLGQFDASRLSATVLGANSVVPELIVSEPAQLFPDAASSV